MELSLTITGGVILVYFLIFQLLGQIAASFWLKGQKLSLEMVASTSPAGPDTAEKVDQFHGWSKWGMRLLFVFFSFLAACAVAIAIAVMIGVIIFLFVIFE